MSFTKAIEQQPLEVFCLGCRQFKDKQISFSTPGQICNDCTNQEAMRATLRIKHP